MGRIWFVLGLTLMGACGSLLLADTSAVATGAQTVGEAWRKAVVSNDMDAILACYSPDADLWLPGMPPAHGLEEIRRTFVDFMSHATIKAATVANEHYETRGDLSVGWGEYMMTLDHKPGGGTFQMEGRFTVIAKMESGAWVFLVDHASTQAVPSVSSSFVTTGVSASGETKPEYITGDVQPPQRMVFYPPRYPEGARLDRTEGKVILEVVVDKEGNVVQAKVLKSNPVFDEAAKDAVLRWKYKPAMKDGKPVKVYLTVIIEFNLKKQEGGGR